MSLTIINTLTHVALIGLSIVFFLVICKKSCVGGGFSEDHQDHFEGAKWCFMLIMLIAILVRVIEFGNIPGGLNQDEARTAIDAKAILEYGTDVFGISNPAWLSTMVEANHQSVMLAWLQMPFIKVFGFSVFSIRLPMLIISLLGLVVLYLYVRDIKGERLALVVLGLGAICPYYIMKSRFALECDVFPHFTLFGMFFLNKLEKKYIYLSMVLFGLSMYCYGLSFVTIPFLLLFSAIWLYRKKLVNIKDIFVCIFIYFATSLPEWVTMVVNALRLESVVVYGFTCPYCPYDVRRSDLLFMNFSFGQMIKNIWRAFEIVFLQNFDISINQIRYIGPYYIFSIPFLIWGIYKVFAKCKRGKDEKENTRNVLLLLYGAAGLCTGVMVKVNVSRIGHIFYPILVLTGIGIIDIVRRRWKSRYYIIGIYMLGFTLFCVKYFGGYRETYGFYTDFCKAIIDLRDSGRGDGMLYKMSSMGGTTHTQESILMFYHQVNPLEYQGIENMEDGIPFSEKYTYYFFSVSEIEEEYIMPGEVWIVQDYFLEYLRSKYVMNVTDYGTWNVVTVAENALEFE